MNEHQRIRVLLISPLRAITLEGKTYSVEDNIVEVRRCCRTLTDMGFAPFAPHAFYTQFLDDTIVGERTAGMECGEAWLESAEVAVVRAPTLSSGGSVIVITSGMKNDISACVEAQIPTVFWDGTDSDASRDAIIAAANGG
jgi:hypothetical protein